MNDKAEIMPVENAPANQNQQLPSVSAIASMSPLQQMAQAKQMGLSVDEMKEMLELQKDWEANEARKAFYAALAEFNKNKPRIVKDKLNKKYGSDYTSIGNMVNTVSEAMAPFGLSASWAFADGENGKIECTCVLAHTMGHEKKVTLSGLPDTAGSKNPLQERKSTRTYLKLETFEAVTGMTSISGNADDDGNGAAPVVNRITEEQALILDAKITDNNLPRQPFTTWLSKFFPYTKGNAEVLMAEDYATVLAKLESTIENLKKTEQE